MPETEPVYLKPTFSPKRSLVAVRGQARRLCRLRQHPRMAQTPAPTIAQGIMRHNLWRCYASASSQSDRLLARRSHRKQNVSGSVDAMLGQVPAAQKPFVNTYWDPGLGRYVEGNMETDRPWEKYGLGANTLYNTDKHASCLTATKHDRWAVRRISPKPNQASRRRGYSPSDDRQAGGNRRNEPLLRRKDRR